MYGYLTLFCHGTLKFFFLFTPFAALSMYLCLSSSYSEKRRKHTATRIMISAFLICVSLLFLGNEIFSLFGITLDAFRVGVGTILLLNGIGLVKGKDIKGESDPERDIAVVPMAMPVIVGPATIGTVLVMGSELENWAVKAVNISAMAAASLLLWAMLYAATHIKHAIGNRGLDILSKTTGLVLASLAAQMILTGVKDALVSK